MDGSSTIMQRIIDAPFHLGQNRDALDNADNRAFFNSTFPDNKGYSYDGLFLYIYHPSPRPPVYLFAGVPVIFMEPRTSPHALPDPMPMGFNVHPRQGAIARHLDYYDHPVQDLGWEPLFDAIRAHFEEIRVPISEVIFWVGFVHIVLRDTDTDRTVLPYQAGKIACRYLYEMEMGRPATRQSQTRNTNPNEALISASNDKDKEPPQIRGLRRPRRHEVVTLDVPETGVLYGSVLANSKRCLSSTDDGNKETEWVDVSYLFMGVDNGVLPDRICGAAVRAQDQIVSFIRYQVVGGGWTGWCTGTTI